MSGTSVYLIGPFADNHLARALESVGYTVIPVVQASDGLGDQDDETIHHGSAIGFASTGIAIVYPCSYRERVERLISEGPLFMVDEVPFDFHFIIPVQDAAPFILSILSEHDPERLAGEILSGREGLTSLAEEALQAEPGAISV